MEEIEKNMNTIQKDLERVYPEALKAVLFDMDNTLFDFVAAKLEACREILSFIWKGDVTEEPSELFRYFLRGVYGLKIMKIFETTCRREMFLQLRATGSAVRYMNGKNYKISSSIQLYLILLISLKSWA